MYNIRPNIVIGFHGCDKSVAVGVVCGEKDLMPSTNKYDWLGHGIYFGENDYERALEFAKETQQRNHSIQEPFVLGAVFVLGKCLDLTTRENIETLKLGYENIIKPSMDSSSKSVPSNKVPPSSINGDILLRELDCFVIEAVVKADSEVTNCPYDSVKAAFWEGEALYPTEGFRSKNHIQICIRNPKCILGYFLPKDVSSLLQTGAGR